jgi:hypothetical protein
MNFPPSAHRHRVATPLLFGSGRHARQRVRAAFGAALVHWVQEPPPGRRRIGARNKRAGVRGSVSHRPRSAGSRPTTQPGGGFVSGQRTVGPVASASLIEDGKCGQRGRCFRSIAQSRRSPGVSPTAAVDPKRSSPISRGSGLSPRRMNSGTATDTSCLARLRSAARPHRA